MRATAASSGEHAGAPATPPLIALQGVWRAFADTAGGASVTALADLTLTIDAGEFVAVVGKSGSGKSTLLHILGCLDRPSRGVYRLAGADVGGAVGGARAKLRREAFGFVFQDYSLLDALSARANVELPAKYAGVGRAARRARALRLLTSLGLAERADHRPAELSGGEQQRVAVARALMNGGRVILADEPTGALDAAAGEDVVERLAALAEIGHTVVLATHDAKVAARATRRIELRDGRIAADSGPHGAAQPRLAWRAPPARRGAGRAVDALRDAHSALATAWRHRRLGTTLSATSVAMGVWCLLTLVGVVGGGLRHGLDAAILHMGADIIDVQRGGTNGVRPARFDIADVAAIRAIANVRAVEVSTGGRLPVQAVDGVAAAALDTYVEATNTNVSVRDDWPLAVGTFHTARDSTALAPVAVIGSSVRDALFGPDDDPVGRRILVGGQPFVVKGVLAPYEAGFLQSQSLESFFNDDVFVPLETGMALLFGDKSLDIEVRVATPTGLEKTTRRLQSLLVARHGVDTFFLSTRSGSVNEWARVQRTMEAVWGGVGIVALLLGGFGVFAVAVIAVRARRREIGIRIAAGAAPKDVALQFLGEAVAVSLVGGALGVLGSVATLYALEAVQVPVEIAPWHVFGALVGVAAAGVLFSAFPALRAARLDPVAALATAA